MIKDKLGKSGETAYTKDGIDGKLFFTEKDLSEMLSYHEKKGEEIPVDSEHFLFALRGRKRHYFYRYLRFDGRD